MSVNNNRVKQAFEILNLMLSERVIADCYTEHSYGSDIAYIKISLSENTEKRRYSFEEVRSLIEKAAANIPPCAIISSARVSFCNNLSEEKDEFCLSIEVRVKISALRDKNSVLVFHEIAHSAFNTDMGFIS